MVTPNLLFGKMKFSFVILLADFKNIDGLKLVNPWDA